MWECRYCTYRNSCYLPVCEMCDCHREEDAVIIFQYYAYLYGFTVMLLLLVNRLPAWDSFGPDTDDVAVEFPDKMLPPWMHKRSNKTHRLLINSERKIIQLSLFTLTDIFHVNLG